MRVRWYRKAIMKENAKSRVNPDPLRFVPSLGAVMWPADTDLGTLPLRARRVVLPQKARTRTHDGCREVQWTGQRVAIAPSARVPLGIEATRAGEKLIGEKS